METDYSPFAAFGLGIEVVKRLEMDNKFREEARRRGGEEARRRGRIRWWTALEDFSNAAVEK